MDFKKFRLSRNLTQNQAGDLIGMSGTYWGWLESGSDKVDDAHAKAFARVLKYLGHPEIDTPLSRERLEVKRLGINKSEASVMMGAGKSTWSNIATGNLEPTRRWTRLCNSLIIELEEKQRASHPAQDLQPSGEIETIQPTILTPGDETDMQEPEISDQALIPFAYGSQSVRCKLINDQPWWVLRDVCSAIGYAYPENASLLVDSEDMQKLQTLTPGGVQSVLYVNEPGLYQFLARAQVESVKPFQRWLFKEVLPQIRKTGQYSHEPVQPAQVDPLDAIILSLTEIKAVKVKQAQMEATIEAQAQQIKQIEQRTPTDPRHSAKLTLLELQALNSKKAQLHKLKAAIVRQAERNTDDFSLPFRKHGNVWRYIHSQAVPAVASLNDYTTKAQLNTAINGAEILLTRLGGVLPQQLSIDIESEAV